MDEQRDNSLRERVERLEKAVEELQRVFGKSSEAPTPESVGVPAVPERSLPPLRPAPGPGPRSPKSVKRPARSAESFWKSESWLKIIGIGLLLLGVVFLFKFSIDRGWITESVRVAFGLTLGIGLLVAGVRVYAKRRHFSQVFLGGSVAVFYITGFAAFQLYALVSHPVAFTFMVSVTLLGFFLALRQREAILSIIGAAGGLGTPFLLYTGSGSLPKLIGYTCLVLGGTSAIYMYRGWRSLLWTSVVGGWAVLLTGHIQGDTASAGDRWALQVGIVFAWLAFWALPVIRGILEETNPQRWPHPSPDSLAKVIRGLAKRHAHMLSVSTPLLALAFSRSIWSLSDEAWGWLHLGGVVVYGCAAWISRRWIAARPLAYTQALVSLLLLTLAFCWILEGNSLLLTLVAEAVVVHLIARRLADRGTEISGHLLFAGVGVWIAARLIAELTEGTAVLNAEALISLVAIGTGAGISAVLQRRGVRSTYRLIAHIAFLGWILKELSPLEGGQGYVTVAWGIYAVALLVLGIRRNFNQLLAVAMGTLLVVVVKLFLVDLARLEAIWRILLFLGFGGLFLVLSYYFQALWKRPVKSADKFGDGESVRQEEPE